MDRHSTISVMKKYVCTMYVIMYETLILHFQIFFLITKYNGSMGISSKN